MTLLEIMIAMLILALGLALLAGSFPMSAMAVIDGGFLTVANSVAMSRLEVAERTDYGALPSLVESNVDLTSAGFPGYQRTTTVASFSAAAAGACLDAGPPDCRRIAVTVQTPIADLAATFSTIVTRP